jgi:hypothetical protein
MMTDLIACISSGKGTIAHVNKVIEEEDWEKIFIITTDQFKDEIPDKKKMQKILIDNTKMLPELIEDIKNALKGRISIMETAVNMISGEGKEHMALLSALLKLGVGIRLVAFTKDGVKEV